MEIKEATEAEFEIHLRSDFTVLKQPHAKKLAYTVTIGLSGTTMLVDEFDTVDTHEFRVISCYDEINQCDVEITDKELIQVIEDYAVSEHFNELDFEYI